ncbi:MAG: FAD-dependent oxidoreductase [Campylobacterota bacterium]|nr:FAD-dependent oxidoreductase [Campylobacterota bacterium]
MKNIETDILIIGAGPSGLVAAATAHENYPNKKIVLVKEYEKAQVPCGIPYVFGNTLASVDKNAMPCGGDVENITKIVDKIIDVDIESKKAKGIKNEILFEKLIFATGSIPFVHKNFQDSLELENVFTVYKEYDKVKDLKEYCNKVDKIVIIGTGFIGVEFASELADINKDITIVGGRHILAASFDEDIAIKAENILNQKGVKLSLGQHASKIVSKNNLANGVELCDGTIIDADLIILATGYQANSSLAKNAKLKLNRYNGIWVDEYMRTKDKDIFAIGDCSGRRDFITRDPSKVMLASTSAAEARVAGSSLYSLKNLKGFNGTIAIFSTMLDNTAFASAGVTQHRADLENIEYSIGFFEGMNRHPGTIPDAMKQSVKLIVMKNSGQIIGGQVAGGKEAGEIINIIGLAIEAELTIHNIISLQVATQPLLTAAPTTYPIVKAAQNALNKNN